MSTTGLRRRPVPVGLFLAALVAGVGCGSDTPVTLGVSSSPPFLDAARLALDDASTAGSIPNLDTIFLPEASNLASLAIQDADALVAVPGLVAVVGHSNSAASLAAAPIYNAHSVVQIAPTSSSVVYSQAGPYSFRLVPPDDEQGLFLARQLSEEMPHGGRVAVLYVNDDYGRGLHATFMGSLDRGRFAVVLDLPHTEGDIQAVDIAETVDALRAARPDMVLWLARGTVLLRFIDQIREALPGVPVLGADALGAGGTTNDWSERWRGVRYVGFVDMGGSEALLRFSSAYSARFHGEATDASALTYDAVGLIIAGMRAGARSGDDMRAYLVSLGHERPPYQGITGPIAFDDAGDVQRSYVVKSLGPGGAR